MKVPELTLEQRFTQAMGMYRGAKRDLFLSHDTEIAQSECNRLLKTMRDGDIQPLELAIEAACVARFNLDSPYNSPIAGAAWVYVEHQHSTRVKSFKTAEALVLKEFYQQPLDFSEWGSIRNKNAKTIFRHFSLGRGISSAYLDGVYASSVGAVIAHRFIWMKPRSQMIYSFCDFLQGALLLQLTLPIIEPKTLVKDSIEILSDGDIVEAFADGFCFPFVPELTDSRVVRKSVEHQLIGIIADNILNKEENDS